MGRVSKITESKYTGVEKFGNVEKDSLEDMRIFKYDEKGNKVEETFSGTFSNEPIKVNFTYKYEYDKTGNWIKRINYQDGVLGSITEREIEYY